MLFRIYFTFRGSRQLPFLGFFRIVKISDFQRFEAMICFRVCKPTEKYDR